ncbi:MAG: LTA synthase family protein, partial [Clostridium sp.]
MLNYNINQETEKVNLPLRIKRKFIEGVKNRDFLITLSLILFKSTLFIFLISDDKANGVNLKLVFYSMPPILVWITILSAYISIAFYFKGRAQKWSFYVLNLLFTILCIGDMWYYRSNSVFLNYHMLGMTSNLENLGSSIISMIRLVDIVFIIDLVYLLIKNIKNRNSYKKYERNVVGGLAIFLLCITYLIYVNIKVDKLGKGFENQLIFRGSWSPNQTMSNLTPIGYHIFDGFTFIEETKAYVFDNEEKEEVLNTLKSIKEENITNNFNGILKGKNLVLVQWESLETFVIGQKVNNQEITPNLNKILGNSFYFNNFHE